LNLQLPTGIAFLSGLINRLHLNRVRNFDEVWIPDEPGPFKFSGELSNSSLKIIKYVGILSRFGSNGRMPSEVFNIVGLVSGPEPQRTNFENILRAQLIRLKEKSILVKGKPGFSGVPTLGRDAQLRVSTEVEHLNSDELE